MANPTRDQLRLLFGKSEKSVNFDDKPEDTLPIIKLSDFNLSEIETTANYTFGYGDTLRTTNSTALNQKELSKITDRDGEVIDNKYRILSPLGAGGASEVYLCERLLVGDRVALKLMRRSYAADPDTARRFHLEALTTASIRHPNVVTIHDFDFADDGTPFMVTELLRGQTLQGELSRQRRLGLRRLLQIITPICSALNVAHLRGVIHRDLKPANIVLHRMDADTEIMKLIDFGIAKHFLDVNLNPVRTSPGMVVGTPAYMAPERCMEESYDARSDIYNMGLIIYEMLAGHHPFQAKTMTAMMAKQISEQPAPLVGIVPDLPESAQKVIFKALEKLPEDRFATALEFADELNSTFYASWMQ